MRLKILDIVSGLISLAVIAFIGLNLYAGAGQALYAHVITEEGEWYYPLSEELTMDFTGPVGITTIQIKNQYTNVTYSDCPDKICVLSPPINQVGQWIICLPNQVMVEILGQKDNQTDVDSY